MFKINIVVIGKVKEKYFQDGIEEYTKRLGRYGDIKITTLKEENFVSEPNDSEINQILFKEGQSLSKYISDDSILLCIEGKEYSSVEFSNLLKKYRDEKGEITFVIGGSYGISDDIKKRCKEKFSFSKMTFPHTLARLMLVEQIYRGLSILEGGKYHK